MSEPIDVTAKPEAAAPPAKPAPKPAAPAAPARPRPLRAAERDPLRYAGHAGAQGGADPSALAGHLRPHPARRGGIPPPGRDRQAARALQGPGAGAAAHRPAP